MGRRTHCSRPVAAFIPKSWTRFLFNWLRCRLRRLGRHSLVSLTSLGTYVLSWKALAAVVHVANDDWFSVDLQMISAASAEIEASAYLSSRSFFLFCLTRVLIVGGKNFQTYEMVRGVRTLVPGYAIVQGIFIGVVAAFVILITIVGPEYVHSLFSSQLQLLIFIVMPCH